MDKRVGLGEGHVVEEFMIGNTRVKICDDYCRDKTPEDVQAILDRIARNAYDALYWKEMQKRESTVADN